MRKHAGIPATFFVPEKSFTKLKNVLDAIGEVVRLVNNLFVV